MAIFLPVGRHFPWSFLGHDHVFDLLPSSHPVAGRPLAHQPHQSHRKSTTANYLPPCLISYMYMDGGPNRPAPAMIRRVLVTVTGNPAPHLMPAQMTQEKTLCCDDTNWFHEPRRPLLSVLWPRPPGDVAFLLPSAPGLAKSVKFVKFVMIVSRQPSSPSETLSQTRMSLSARVCPTALPTMTPLFPSTPKRHVSGPRNDLQPCDTDPFQHHLDRYAGLTPRGEWASSPCLTQIKLSCDATRQVFAHAQPSV